MAIESLWLCRFCDGLIGAFLLLVPFTAPTTAITGCNSVSRLEQECVYSVLCCRYLKPAPNGATVSSRQGLGAEIQLLLSLVWGRQALERANPDLILEQSHPMTADDHPRPLMAVRLAPGLQTNLFGKPARQARFQSAGHRRLDRQPSYPTARYQTAWGV